MKVSVRDKITRTPKHRDWKKEEYNANSTPREDHKTCDERMKV